MTHSFLVFLQIIEFIFIIVLYGAVAILFTFIVEKIINKINEKKHKRIKFNKRIYIVITFVFISTIIVLGIYNMNNLKKTTYTVYTDKKFTVEQGGQYTVALIADYHYGNLSNKKNIKRLCERVNKENPDIVVLAGDIVDENSTKDNMTFIFSELGKIKSKYGIFYINGNHDKQQLLKESQRAYTEQELLDTITSHHIIVLQDEKYELNNEFAMIGREDALHVKNRMSVEELVKDISSNSYILSLDHKPGDYKQYENTNVDLMLSGHTHNGQVYPLNFFLKLTAEDFFLYGIKSYYEDRFHAIITTGLGGWLLPVKNSAPAEYVIIDIVSQRNIG